MRTFTELGRLKTFEERFKYLELKGSVGFDTFGFDRYLNQNFYTSREWQRIKREVILRDNGCDLGVDGYTIFGRVIVHHMNPIGPEDILKQTDLLLNPEYLICVSHTTHNAIHYGSEDLLPKGPAERKPNDTCPWRKI